MSDRFALPDDRREACRACSSEKREYLTECWNCETAICSSCRIEDRLFDHDLCRDCATKRLNQELATLMPACSCDWPAWVTYGHQLTITEAA